MPIPSNQQYSFLSLSDEWYTPGKYVEAARKVLGVIDLDPASCEGANRTVRAKRFFDLGHDGLIRPWPGRVFLNPPSSHGIRKKFIPKLIEEYQSGRCTAAILLVPNHTECDWFLPLYDYLLCFTDHRIRFIDHNGVEQRNPPDANVFAYLGLNPEKFSEVFSEFGKIK